jgi:integrase
MACIAKRRGKYVLDYRDPQGKRHWQSFDTRKEADDALVDCLGQINKGSYVAPDREKTFPELCEAFAKKKKPEIKATSWKDYETNLRLHIRPFFGNDKIRAITRLRIEEFRTKCVADGMGVPTINKCVVLLSGVMGYAVEHEWVHMNRAKKLKLKAATAGRDEVGAVDPRDALERAILSPAEFQLVLKNTDARWQPIIQMAGLTGLRQGELVGLTWKCVHLDTATVDVRVQHTAGRFSTLKTEAARRTVPLPEPLVATLRKHKLASKWAKPDDLVFCNTVGNPQAVRYLREGWHAGLAKSGLPLRKFHALRHTYASALIRCSANLKQISELCGHSSVVITLDTYGSLLPGEKEDVVKKLGADMCAVAR